MGLINSPRDATDEPDPAAEIQCRTGNDICKKGRQAVRGYEKSDERGLP